MRTKLCVRLTFIGFMLLRIVVSQNEGMYLESRGSGSLESTSGISQSARNAECLEDCRKHQFLQNQAEGEFNQACLFMCGYKPDGNHNVITQLQLYDAERDKKVEGQEERNSRCLSECEITDYSGPEVGDKDTSTLNVNRYNQLCLSECGFRQSSTITNGQLKCDICICGTEAEMGTYELKDEFRVICMEKLLDFMLLTNVNHRDFMLKSIRKLPESSMVDQQLFNCSEYCFTGGDRDIVENIQCTEKVSINGQSCPISATNFYVLNLQQMEYPEIGLEREIFYRQKRRKPPIINDVVE